MSRLLFVVLALCLSLPGPARAQTSEDDYQALIHSAIAEMDRGQYMEALGLFRRAHELRPSARTLRGIGIAQFEVRDYVGALHALSAALADPRTPLDEALRAEASALIARARAFVAHFQLRLDPPESVLRVDGLEVTLSGNELLLNPGPHTIEASASGHRPLTVQLVAQAGQAAELTLRLDSAAKEAPPVASAHEPPRPLNMATHVHNEQFAPRPVAAWLFVSAAGLAAGAVETGVWWAKLQRDLDHCDSTCRARSDFERRLTVARALTGGFVALSATSLVLGVVQRRHARARLACTPMRGGVGCAADLQF